MKLSEVKQAINIRRKILVASSMFSLKESFAYSLNNYGNFLSVIVYMVTYLFFLDVLFGRVTVIAGYNYAEMLVFTLVIQINFYLTQIFSLASIDQLDISINTGELDLWLAKPVPLLWFVTFRKINLGEILFTALPATIPLLFMLMGQLAHLKIHTTGIIPGLTCIILGQVIIHCFQFIICLTTFFTGEGKNAKNMATELSIFGDSIPLEGYPNILKVVGFTIIPALVPTALAVSYMLGKTTNYIYLLYVLFLTGIFLWLKTISWKFALRHYSSASS